jgi:hypothetical protein
MRVLEPAYGSSPSGTTPGTRTDHGKEPNVRKTKVFIFSAALSATALLPAVAQAKASWT